MTAPGWFVDPAGEHGLRYWDGTAWTSHVADPAGPVGPTPPTAPPRSGRGAGWAGLVLCVVAVVAVAAPTAAFVSADDGPSVRLDGTRQELTLTPDSTYGVFVEDGDNSSYSLTCSVEDGDGRPIELRDPSWFVAQSMTETLDYTFESGTGDVVARCSARDATVSIRPHESIGPLAISSAVGVVAGITGLTLLIIWFARRLERPAQSTRQGSHDD